MDKKVTKIGAMNTLVAISAVGTNDIRTREIEEREVIERDNIMLSLSEQVDVEIEIEKRGDSRSMWVAVYPKGSDYSIARNVIVDNDVILRARHAFLFATNEGKEATKKIASAIVHWINGGGDALTSFREWDDRHTLPYYDAEEAEEAENDVIPF